MDPVHDPEKHHLEWTRSRMSTYNYIVTLVFYSYCLVRSLLQRRAYKSKLSKFKSKFI